MHDTTDVAIVGAGPYGLALAAHLRPTGLTVRQFGIPMRPWRSAMPHGMYLKSQGFASNIADPAGTHTLGAFCAATGRPYASYGLPIPLDTFIAYGQWFQHHLAPGLEETLVTHLARRGGRYHLRLADGRELTARNAVIATGIEHFAHIPQPLATLPPSLCTHSSAHTDLAAYTGQTVIVAGAGQSALETAALLHENGATVHIVARAPRVMWNGQPLDPHRPFTQRLAEPESGLGSGWATWFYATRPGLFRHLPESVRVHRARTALGPAGACWLRPRVDGTIPIHTGHTITTATAEPGGARLGLATPAGQRRDLTADHVIAATGYRPSLHRLTFLDRDLRRQLRTVAATPAVGPDYQSSVPGLYFTGPAVAPTFGPVMRFVYGTSHAAHTLATRLAATTSHRTRTPAGARR